MGDQTLAIPSPPISHIEVVSPAHGMLGTENHPRTRVTEQHIVRWTRDGPTISPTLYGSCTWDNVHHFAHTHWQVDKREFELRFRYNQFSITDITRNSWASNPERFEFVQDCAPDGRCVRIYAFFYPRDEPLRDEPPFIGDRGDVVDVWWYSLFWNSIPPWYRPHSSFTFAGADSEWVRMTGAAPPWLAVHTMPPSSSVLPPSPDGSVPRGKSRFLEIAVELRLTIYGFLFDFEPLRKSATRLQWPADRYLRQTPAILLVCRKIKDEAQMVLHDQPLRLTHGPKLSGSRFASSITHLISPALIRNLRFIRLQYRYGRLERRWSRRLDDFLEMAVNIVGLWLDSFQGMDGKGRRGQPSRILTMKVDNVPNISDGSTSDRLETLMDDCNLLQVVAAGIVRIEYGDFLQALSSSVQVL